MVWLFEKNGKESMFKKMYVSKVEGESVRGRPKRGQERGCQKYWGTEGSKENIKCSDGIIHFKVAGWSMEALEKKIS